ncbi:MAG: sigma-70 family RNA polymerase sigma factor [Brevinematales bacterium]|nr:sigma-70 family RNA polymerase sigma factor [Brevinematales bacterium]
MFNQTDITHDEIRRIVSKVVRDIIKRKPEYRELIQDLIQEGTVKAIESIPKFDRSRGASIRTFVRKCVKNEIINYLKSFSKYKTQELDENLEMVDSRSSDYELRILEKQVKTFIETNDKLFSEEDKEILDLWLMGYKYKDIAKKIGKTKKYVDNSIQRIKKLLSQHFKS